MTKSFKPGKLYRCCSSENGDIGVGTTIFVIAVLPFDREQVRNLPFHTYNKIAFNNSGVAWTGFHNQTHTQVAAYIKYLDEAGMVQQSILRLEHWNKYER